LIVVANINSWYYICKYIKTNFKKMENEKIVWSPEAKIEITGREFEFLARIMSLYEVPVSQLSHKDINDLFIPAIQASQDILKRMIETGVASKEGEFPTVSDVATEEPTF
jgi:hypothetical protein